MEKKNEAKRERIREENANVNKRRTTLKRNIANTKRLGIFSFVFLTHRTDDKSINCVCVCFDLSRKELDMRMRTKQEKTRERENGQSTLYKTRAKKETRIIDPIKRIYISECKQFTLKDSF
jgi:hypothetical protein